MSGKLYYAEKENTIYIKADGHITAILCPDIKKRIFSRYETVPVPGMIYIDLQKCTYMDSTFLGFLTGLNLKLEKLTGNKVTIVGAPAECLNLLQSMELTHVLNISSAMVSFPDNLEEVSIKTDIEPQFLLKSHEDLMSISDENKRRFATLHDILQQQINDSAEKK